MTSPEQPLITNPTERNAAAARLPANVLSLGVVSLLNDSAGDMVQPLLPAFVGTIGGGPLALGLIEGIADATASLLQLGSGYLADRIGRLKAATTAGYAVTAIARPLLALAQTWWQILGARFGDRIGKGIRTAPRDALLADTTPFASRGRAYGFHRAMDNAGAIVGPRRRGRCSRADFRCARYSHGLRCRDCSRW
jgi:MFS family permease